MNTTTKPVFLAAIFIAIALTFSCSSSNDNDDVPSSSSNGDSSSSAEPNPSSSSVAPSSSSVSPSSSSVAPSSSSVASSSSSSSSLDSNSGTFIDSRDEQTYRWVEIGNQIWMAENLNYWKADDDVGVCYGNNPDNCALYGRLYDWAEAMGFASDCNSKSCASDIQSKHRGICPDGWHIPSEAEWDAFVKYVDPNFVMYAASGNDAGTMLKATHGWPGIATDDFGFSALPGGYCRNGACADIESRGYWWSAREIPVSIFEPPDEASGATRWCMFWDRAAIFREMEFKSSQFSVRCVKALPGGG